MRERKRIGNALGKLLQTRVSGVFNALKTSWKIKLHADGTVYNITLLHTNHTIYTQSMSPPNTLVLGPLIIQVLVQVYNIDSLAH